MKKFKKKKEFKGNRLLEYHFHHFLEFQKISRIRGKSTDWNITSIISWNSRDYTRGQILLSTSFTYCHISVTCRSYGGGGPDLQNMVGWGLDLQFILLKNICQK